MHYIKLTNTRYTTEQRISGKTTGHSSISTAKVDRGVLVIGFSLVQGKGHAEVKVHISDNDICTIMHDLAARRPDLAARFAECTSVAIQNLIAK